MPTDSAPRERPAATASLDERVERSRREWRLLFAHLRTVTPQSLGRGLVAATAAGLVAWLAVATWPTLLPFAVGGFVAYAVFPLVGVLERFMPRLLAAAVATAVGFGAILAVLAIVVPPLVEQALAVVANAPDSADVAKMRADVDAYLATLPETPRTIATGVLDRASGQLSANVAGILDVISAAAVQAVTHLLSTIGNVIGAILLPIWVLFVVRDGNQVKKTVSAQFAPGIRPDAMALLRIVDRAVGTFVRVQIAGALLTGAGVWLGMTLLERAGVATYNRELAIAGFAGLVQLLPQVGWLLGLVPAAIGFAVQPDHPAAPLSYLAIYAVTLRLVNVAIGQRMGRVLSIRSSLAVPGVVLLSGLGVVPLLLSAPLLVIGRDTVLYLRGRLSEPSARAGVLPGERAQTARAAPRTVPPLYQAALVRGRASIAPRVRERPAPQPRGETT